MRLQNNLKLNDDQLNRFHQIDRNYKQMCEDPAHCQPMFIINTPVSLPSWEDRLADPLVMLQAELDLLRAHMEIRDDRTPTVRVQFGTAQVAAAFGCEVFVPPNNLPAVGSHILKCSEDVNTLAIPSMTDGWYGKLAEFTRVYRENLPEGVFIQHPDIQSSFNTAHLIRGNDILLDFYDDPEAVDTLLDKVTDYLIRLVPHLNVMIGNTGGWFYDWGALWKGAARISNCSMHLISPALYEEHILPRDIRLMHAIGGGRMHYCGTSSAVIDMFFKCPDITGLDYDLQHHDLWDLAQRTPEHVTLLQWGDALSGTEKTAYVIERLLSGDWPQKRNVIIQLEASSIKEGKELLRKLRESVKPL